MHFGSNATAYVWRGEVEGQAFNVISGRDIKFLIVKLLFIRHVTLSLFIKYELCQVYLYY